MDMNMEPLIKKIDLYFDAQLTRQEEKSLLRELLSQQGSDPRIDEALAVMLAARIAPQRKARKRQVLRKALSAAAAAAVILTAGYAIHHFADRGHGDMLAYVGGVRIKDPNEIKNIIATQLNDIGESTDLIARTVSDDFDDISEALTTDDI